KLRPVALRVVAAGCLGQLEHAGQGGVSLELAIAQQQAELSDGRGEFEVVTRLRVSTPRVLDHGAELLALARLRRFVSQAQGERLAAGGGLARLDGALVLAAIDRLRRRLAA